MKVVSDGFEHITDGIVKVAPSFQSIFVGQS